MSKNEQQSSQATLPSAHVVASAAGGCQPIIGRLVGLANGQLPLVMYAGQTGSASIAARATIDLQPEAVGHEILIVFEASDPQSPVVIGVVRNPQRPPSAALVTAVHVESDGEQVVIAAQERIVLRCGSASITLTSAGKVLIEGSHVVSRSTGANKIKGARIELN